MADDDARDSRSGPEPPPRGAPVVIVHDRRHAAAALRVLGSDPGPAVLLSPRGFAGYAGASFFREMIAAARRDAGVAAGLEVLDCDDLPGHVLAAFDAGLPRVAFAGPRAVRRRLESIGLQCGSLVLRPFAADLDLAGADDAEAACRALSERRRRVDSGRRSGY